MWLHIAVIVSTAWMVWQLLSIRSTVDGSDRELAAVGGAFPPSVAKAVVTAHPVAAVGMTALLLSGVTARIGVPWATIVAWTLLGLAVGCGLLVGALVFFGRPRCLIPVRWRSSPVGVGGGLDRPR